MHSIKTITNEVKEVAKGNYSNSKLEAVLKSIVNGVIAIDNSGNVILINDSAKRILDISDAEVIGKHLLEVIRNYKLTQALDDYINNRTDVVLDFEITLPPSKNLSVFINPIMSSEFHNKRVGSVIVFNDITELKRLEKVRSDFVANVSHELRTPLTSIMGFVETLRDGNVKDEDTLKKFLDIISLETERLTRLINDILTLSKIENVKEDINKELIDLKSEIEDVIYILENKAKGKNIKVSLSVQPDNLKVSADKDWIRQLLLNLIDNSIKYNKDNGYIWIRAWEDIQDVCISVKDTGIGIKEEYIPRIFERFYWVDKGRSGNAGGTGLGLAVVKHIEVTLVAGLKLVTDLERIADHAVDISNTVKRIADEQYIKPLIDIPRMADMVKKMVNESLDSYVNQDSTRAFEITKMDDEIDYIYKQMFRELLTYMMEDPKNISQVTQFLFVGRYLERIADHATNICKWVIYIDRGTHEDLNK